jgi:methylenetetrahydrofolate dehydrogenase (NADP+) / methenyltetrahydrofolate cyclohydrolase
MILLDGKKTSQEIKDEIKIEVDTIRKSGGKIPHLAAVLVGNVGASLTYVSSKIKSCEEVGFVSSMVELPETVSEEELLKKIAELNSNKEVDGYIVQLPLPAHIDEKKVTEAIDPKKDVDGFHPVNIGKMMLNLSCFLPATPYGIMQLLERYKIETEGKHCVVVGRSNIVGLPMSILMGRNTNPGNCTVTLTHSKTKNIKEVCKTADILIVALGKPNYVTADMVKDGAVVVDVGITRVTDTTKKAGFSIVGDVKFDEVAPKCSYITPVPGGVGPMTIASLMKNTVLAAKGKK